MGRKLVRSKKVFEDGIWFDSKSELRRYRELKLLVSAGNIVKLHVHPEYILQEAFTTITGEKIKAVKFTPDFEYYENGIHVVEDVKPFKNKKRKGQLVYDERTGRPVREPFCTPVFKLRVWIFQGQHRDVDFRLVEA